MRSRAISGIGPGVGLESNRVTPPTVQTALLP
jgi:hypothetical protein